MNEREMKKLVLNTETLRHLQDSDLRQVVGGRRVVPLEGHKQPSTTIVPTGSPCVVCPIPYVSDACTPTV